MAFTPGTIAPIVPFSGHGGKSPMAPIPVALNTSQAVIAGDVLVYSSGKGTIDNSPATAVAIGVALDEKTTGGSVTDDDVVLVAPALPSSLFLASFMTDASNDLTAYVHATHTNTERDLAEDAVSGVGMCVVIAAQAVNNILIVAPAREQLRGKPFRVSGAGTTINPRVVIAFSDSIYTQAQI